MVVTLFGRGVGFCLATGLPLGCEAVFERGVRYSLCCNKSSSVEVPSVGDSGLEILLGEGGDVELGARTSKHIFVFAFDPLSLNPLFLFVQSIIHSIITYLLVLCLASFILLYHLYAWFACVCLTCT